MANDRYYIGSNPYSQTLNSKTQQYTNLVRDAEAMRLRNGGRPTVRASSPAVVHEVVAQIVKAIAHVIIPS